MQAITKTASAVSAIAMLLLLQGTAYGQEGMPSPQNASASSDMPVYSGGVGDDEMNYIKSVEHQYDLKLMFTEASGTFLADLPVTIHDKQGRAVVTTVTNGPILLVNLPAGNYSVTASDGNVTREQKVTISPHSQRTYQLRFPTHPGEISKDSN
jgi:hypothetical protein